ncbi:MAG: hypothetical protein ACI95X_001853, partial [Paraglaciecola sp.]
ADKALYAAKKAGKAMFVNGTKVNFQ